MSGVSDSYGAPALSRPVTIVIPAYGAAAELGSCLSSLAEHLPPDCSVVVLDDGTPNNSVRDACEPMRGRLGDFTYVRSDHNRGFVETCNWGYSGFCKPGSDLLLLNSDTEATAGFLQEMQAVLLISERHGVVTPRSNNATIFSVPWMGEKASPDLSFAAWQTARHQLPRFSVAPTAVGFCMLIRAEVLLRFGLFDTIYSPGYNEENDFVCRINRKGYSAVAANWAYVFHKERASFADRREALEVRNSQILRQRYPEYDVVLSRYFHFTCDALEYYLSLYVPHRPRILYDLFHLSPAFNGTSEFALTLLRELSSLITPAYDLFVGIQQSELAFFGRELQGYNFYLEPEHSGQVFDLVFKPAQVLEWADFKRMTRLSPRVCFALQDIIAARCAYISPSQQAIRKSFELADRVFAISAFSQSDFQNFFGMEASMQIIHHGSDFADFPWKPAPKHVLIVGNEGFHHKGIDDALPQVGDEWPVIVIGATDTSHSYAANVRRLTSGNLPRQYIRQVFLEASVVVYPSHYEGFGLPLLDSLALGTPVIALDTEVNREILAATNDQNLYLIPSMRELRSAILRALSSHSPASPNIHSWRVSAEAYAQAFREILSRDIELSKLHARWDLLRSIDAFAPCNTP